MFIRRPHKPTHQLVDDRVVHGHKADWIVLEYREEGRLLNVASHGKKASFVIANQITSAFFDAPCEYVNVEEVVFPGQLQRFLEQLAEDDASELTLVAAELRELPLRGFDTLGGSSELNASVGPGVLAPAKAAGNAAPRWRAFQQLQGAIQEQARSDQDREGGRRHPRQATLRRALWRSAAELPNGRGSRSSSSENTASRLSRRKSAGSKLGRRALLAGLLRQGEALSIRALRCFRLQRSYRRLA